MTIFSKMLRKIFIINMAIILTNFLPLACFGMGDTAVDFLKCIKEEKYKDAYMLLSSNLKSKGSIQDFVLRQKQVQVEFKEVFGATKIIQIAEIIPLNSHTPLLDENTFFRLFSFLPGSGSKQTVQTRIFEFIFANNKIAIVGISTKLEGNQTLVNDYSFLSELQGAILSGRTPFAMRTEIVA